jgi:hypothetical protein
LEDFGLYELSIIGSDARKNKLPRFNSQLVFEGNPLQFDHFEISPNPIRSSFRISYSLKGEKSIESYELNIFNLSGQKVLQFNEKDLGKLHIGPPSFSKPVKTTALEQLPVGVYIYQFKTETLSKEGLFIKQH